MLRLTVFRILAAGLLAVTPFITATRAQEPTPVKGGTLTMLVTPEPSSMTAALNSVLPNQFVASKIFDGLFGYDFDFRLKPQLALSYDASPDGLTATIKLRPNVKWHDGKPFTSADVAWTLLKVWKPLHSRGRVTFANVTAVDTPDPLTVVIHLSAPNPTLIVSLSASESQVLPKHLYDGTDPMTNPANDKPVGTGPFRFVKWDRGASITLERNPDYWDQGKPYLDSIIFRIMPDAAGRATALETGEVLLAGQTPIPLSDVQRFREMPNFAVDTRGYELSNFMQFLEFNLSNPVFQDVRVRRAIALAVNADFIAKNVWFGLATPATSPIPHYLKSLYIADAPPHAFNVAAANKLLDEAGHPRVKNNMRFKVFIDWAPYGDGYRRSAEYIKQALRTVGIDVDIRNQDLPTYLRRVYTDRDFDLITYFAGLGSDPMGGLQRLYWSKAIQKGAPFTNASGYQSPEMDKLLEAAAIEPDTAKRAKLIADFQRLAMTDLPVVPLVEIQNVTIANRRVHNHTQGPEGLRAPYADAWLEPAK